MGEDEDVVASIVDIKVWQLPDLIHDLDSHKSFKYP